MAHKQEDKKDNGENEDEEKQEREEERNCNIQQCQHIDRIIKALHFFNLISNDYNGNDDTEQLLEYFEKYQDLINDYHHILLHHSLNNKLYQKVSNIISCKLEECENYRRNQKNRHSNHDINDIIDPHLKFNMDILDNIHCYLLHSYDVAYCIEETIWNEINAYNDNNNDNNIECIDGVIHKLKQHIVEQRNKNNVPRKTRPHQRYGTFLSDNDDVINCHDLGYRYYYDANTNDTDNINNNIVINRMYKDLKEEMLQNKICCLHINLYQISSNKADKYLKQSDQIKSMSSLINKNEEKISLQHILSIILYCDYEELSAALRKTFTSNNNKKINAKNEYYHWSKLLIESVECFGNTLDKISKFYHYLIPSLVASNLGHDYFKDRSLKFCSPTSFTSTTSELPVAIIYAANNNNNNGILLELQKHSINVGETLKYIDCCLFSYHSNEREKLFFGGLRPLKILNITEINTNTSYKRILSALSLFDNIINAQQSDICKTEIQTNVDIIHNLIKHFDDKQQKYIKIFRLFCKQKQKIIIDLNYFVDDDYSLLSNHFISDTIAPKTVLISNIVKLFTNCTEIEILNKMDISPLYLTQLLAENESLWKNDNVSLKRITFKNVKLDVEDKALHLYQAQFRQNKYELMHIDNNIDIDSNVNIDNNVILIKIDDEYKKISKRAQDELSKILGNKTANDLLSEITKCVAIDQGLDIYTHCESIQRIKILLSVYHTLMKHKKLWRKVSLIPMLTFKNIYTLIQINDDFFHIKHHVDDDDKFGVELFAKFKLKYPCDIINGDNVCGGYSRFRNLFFENNSHQHLLINEDIIFQQECDKIHSYMIHPYDIATPDNINIPDTDNTNKNKQEPGKGYVGRKEDEEWWNYKKYQEEIKAETVDQVEQDEYDYIYDELINNMGVFRWQCCHGFTSTQHEGLMHLKPKYKNVKDEALHNRYYHLSVDNWNQTLRKAQVFYKSFARQRIKTLYAGKYDDKITQQVTRWKQGECIGMDEIVKLKLYTDFDKLQYELKKCFRFETICDIFTLKNFNRNTAAKSKYKYNFDPKDKDIRYKLEQRLCTFYWWRIGLLTVLNKYGKTLSNNIPLYHGVNAKMILNNGKTQRLSFYGPLSTSASYHVARTFATAKGMVLQVTTQYPRLGFCRAFDASLISDYPEEKEHLVGFVYLRIITVLTRPLNKNWKSFHDIDDESNYYQIPLSSETRSIFFAIHLFRQQIFSMSVHLEYWLSSFLYLMCGYNEDDGDNKMDDGRIKQTNRCKQIQTVMEIKHIKHSQNKLDVKTEQNAKNDKIKQDEILKILWNKMDNFRKFPNQKQVVKIDQISDNLKPYFMDYDGEDIHKNAKYIISFIKIVKIFENVKEIHFINKHLFDSIALKKLIQFLDKNIKHKLIKIKFLYYDYDINNKSNILYPTDSQIFCNPDNLDKGLLNRLKQKQWDIKHKAIGKTGGYESNKKQDLKKNITGYQIKINAKNQS